MSFLRNSPLNLVVNWPVRHQPGEHRPDRFQFGEKVSGQSFPLPKAIYNPEIVRYYQLGVGSEDPILRFLAFYQVLEYLFVSVSTEILYQKLQNQIHNPTVRTSPKNLDKIIQDVLDFRGETDEEQMLKNVLEKYADEEELMKFIGQYEVYLKENLYTVQRTLFGTSLRIPLQSGHVFGNTAKVIRTIRNALVHSSDRYDRRERHIPFSQSTEIVRKEIPLLRYLAEKVIVNSAQEMPEFPPRVQAARQSA